MNATDVLIGTAHRVDARQSSVRHVLATAMLVSVAYYIGASIGILLRVPPSTLTVLWPPNAILTAVLLLAPVRRWWIYLLAALPAHLIADRVMPWPVPLILALFVTVCLEALVAAVCVRALSDAPSRFDTLYRAGVFIGGAVLAAPFVSSFPTAGLVSVFLDEPFWLAWRTRFFANVLTQLTLVPSIITVVTLLSGWRSHTARRPYVEVACLALATVIVAVVVMAEPIRYTRAVPGTPYTPLSLFLPLVLWAAVRFGPGGASLSLLSLLVVIVLIARWHQPVTQMSPIEGITAMQMLLSIVAIPLTYLAAAFEERRRSNEALADRLRFEELLVRLSSTFVHLPSDRVETAFESALRQLGQFLALDRITLYRHSREAEQFVVAYSWSTAGVGPIPRVSVIRDFPWITSELLREHPVAFSRPEELPPEAARDAETFRERGIRSNLAVPLVAGGRILGSLAFVTLAVERAWPNDLVQRLRLVGEVFANALAQKEAEDAVRESELMKSAILASVTSCIAVLDREGRIVTVNDGWMRFGRENGGTLQAPVGASYLEACRHAAREGAMYAGEAAAGIEAVLDGSQSDFLLEYFYRLPAGERWFTMSVVPLSVPEGGAVVSHTDTTERKRAELEAQRSRQELAHFTRVSTIGEMTASLAHELNQPLTGILANAQAALRFLASKSPDLLEIREILKDIVDDDRRAGEVIRRLRGLLRKEDVQYRLLDLNVLIRDVAKLLSSDAIIRNLSVRLELDPDPAIVSGDGVQLQQVVLNLLLNAMEAMNESAGNGRTITVRTEHNDTGAIHVSVQDAGTGFRQGTQHLVFEPFYTTKPSGMGMGLAISKSIIEAHGGLIWAGDNALGGATFHFSIPVPARESV